MSSKRKTADINIMRFDKMNRRKVYAIGDLSLLGGHVLYLITFGILGVMPMLAVDIAAIIFYLVLLYILYKTPRRTSLVIVTLMEIVLHACMGIVFMGWQLGFPMFMLFIMPIPFYMPLRKVWLPYVCSMVPLSVYVVMRVFFGPPHEPVYIFHDPFINNLVYFLNVALGAIMLLYCSSIYMFSRELMQYKLTAKNESLQKLATIDPLTQLFNRRAMSEYLKLVQHNSLRTGKGYAVGLGDIDDFKKINDTYGHEAGDEALKQAAGMIAKAVPSEGYAARWGGEEFLFVIPAADISEGVDVAEKIRSSIMSRELKTENGNFRITITIGVSHGEAGDDIEKVISRADKQLYRGKDLGKNTVSS